jgi:hypothetical protein
MKDKRLFDGIVRDPSKPEYILPPLGMILTDGERRQLVEAYGERVTRAWERRNAAFLANRSEVEDSASGEIASDFDSGLTKEEELILLRDLGSDV